MYFKILSRVIAIVAVAASLPLRAATLFNFDFPWNDSSVNALSLQALQPGRAGADGFVSVDGAGHLATSAGRIRFWGTNTTFSANFPSNADAVQVAGRLAKLGFNIVRFHHMDSQWSGLWGSLPDRALNSTNIARMDYFIDQLAAKGIYSNLNLVVSRPFEPGTELDSSISGISDTKIRAALGFFDPAQLALQKQFANDLLNHVNPYTGNAYKDEPALAFIEINNENGLVQAFKSQQLDGLPAYYTNLLNQQWVLWLQSKYGTHAALASAWGASSTALGTEKMINGTFITNTASWNLEHNGTPLPVATVSAVPDGVGGTNVAKIILTSPGSANWSVQFNQGGRSVTGGAPYTLGFWAKADAAKTISVDLGMDHTPWGNLGFNTNLNLTTVWQYFEYTFLPNATDVDARINFSSMGLLTGIVWLGNISLKPGGVVGFYPGEDLDSSVMRNFLYSGETVARTTEALKDWLRFLLATEETYWIAMRDHVKSVIGAKSLVMGTVQGCSTPNLQAAFDVIDTHYYWQHPSFPSVAWDAIDWNVLNDPMVNNAGGSVMASLGVRTVLGKPSSCTEVNTPFPNTFEADIFLLSAAYGGLQDFDAIYPFDYWGTNTSWAATGVNNLFSVSNNPVKMAGMQAASLAFRRGDFAPGQQLIAAPMTRANEIDQLVNASAWSLVNAQTAGEDPRAALIHRVRQVIEGQSVPGGSLAPGSTSVSAPVLASDTGQLNWDQSQAAFGLVTGDSPRSQFAAGFFNGRSVALVGLTFSAVSSLQGGDYAVLALSSLDHQDLSVTASALLTVLGTQRNTGSNYYQYPSTPISFPPAKGALVTLRNQWGSGPAQVEGVSVTVTLAYPGADTQVWALDKTGARATVVPVINAAGKAQVQVGSAYQAMHYEIVVNVLSPTPTPSPTLTPSPTPVATATVTPSPAVVDPGGPLKVLRSEPVPQPQAGLGLNLAVNLEGGAGSLQVKIYSSGYSLIAQAQAPGPFGAGWSSARFSGLDLANGTYFYVVEACRGTVCGRAQAKRLVILR